MFIKKLKNILRESLWYFKNFYQTDSNPVPDFSSVLFICKGNIIRSVFAEKLAENMSGERPIAKFDFYSAGLDAKEGTPSPELAVEVAGRYGINLSDHRSRQLTAEMMQEYDIVLCMESWHVKWLKKSFPGHIGKIFLLPHFENKKNQKKYFLKHNIPDPYGTSMDNYNSVFSMIEKNLTSLFEKRKG